MIPKGWRRDREMEGRKEGKMEKKKERKGSGREREGRKKRNCPPVG